jgi:hypothetical protein
MNKAKKEDIQSEEASQTWFNKSLHKVFRTKDMSKLSNLIIYTDTKDQMQAIGFSEESEGVKETHILWHWHYTLKEFNLW